MVDVDKKNRGFTLIELLLILIIMGILSVIIFISIGNQREKARLNNVLQTAKGSHAISQECYFRLGRINQPAEGSEICTNSSTEWFSITVPGCVYSTLTSAELQNFYEISCSSIGKKVRCGIRSGSTCEISDI